MQNMAIALPVQPGKTDAFRAYVEELTGPRADEDAAFQRKFGVHRQAVWLQETPEADLVILYQEAEGLDRAREARREIARSDDPHLAWKRESYADVYGMRPDADPPPLPEKLHDETYSGVDEEERDRLERIAVAMPVLPGKAELVRRFFEELEGPKAEEDHAFASKYGIRREAQWLQQTPDGDLEIVYQEVDDLDRSLEGLRAILEGDDEFLTWLREQFVDIHGIDPAGGPPPIPEKLADRTFA